jgi:hypothetical protein
VKKTITLLGLALVGSVLIALGQVKTDYDHKADFGKYHTYSWIKVQAENPLWNDRITNAVDSQLSAKGWTKVQSGGDVSVAAYGATHTQQNLETWYDGFGGGWRWRGFGDGMATTTVEKVPVGTLTVDMFDTSNKQLIWRGSSSDTLSDKPDKNEKKLDKSVADMFKKFPPESKG